MLAAAAMLAALSFSVAQAGAASGSGGVSTGDDSAERSSKREAKYDRLWDEVSKRNKRWARKTAECESGKDPKAIGGGGKYRGAFQFLKSTWRRSPKSPGGDPIEYRYKTQAVVAVALKQRDGAHHWPVCG
ncbi:MAG TPA: transglycosylase family protein [Solirubrobacterales bacterium]|nr:transglycosylase family protein [Solirubrobacterales bacterium]